MRERLIIQGVVHDVSSKQIAAVVDGWLVTAWHTVVALRRQRGVLLKEGAQLGAELADERRVFGGDVDVLELLEGNF